MTARSNLLSWISGYLKDFTDSYELSPLLEKHPSFLALLDAVEFETQEKLHRLEAILHRHGDHPDYEYTRRKGPRKCWDYADVPPDGEGWERNIEEGRNGWERFEYHEESYWRRTKVRDDE